jgi:hypothetical protein
MSIGRLRVSSNGESGLFMGSPVLVEGGFEPQRHLGADACATVHDRRERLPRDAEALRGLRDADALRKILEEDDVPPVLSSG